MTIQYVKHPSTAKGVCVANEGFPKVSPQTPPFSDWGS